MVHNGVDCCSGRVGPSQQGRTLSNAEVPAPLLARRLRLAGRHQEEGEGAGQQRQGDHPARILRRPAPLRDHRLRDFSNLPKNGINTKKQTNKKQKQVVVLPVVGRIRDDQTRRPLARSLQPDSSHRQVELRLRLATEAPAVEAGP